MLRIPSFGSPYAATRNTGDKAYSACAAEI